VKFLEAGLSTVNGCVGGDGGPETSDAAFGAA
jgi:hypothetical protein